MITEQDSRRDIDESLENQGWILTDYNKNVFMDYQIGNGRADYVLFSKDRKIPIIIIEAKRRGKDLTSALEQAKGYAKTLNVPIIYASDGCINKTLHIETGKPLMLNGEEIDHFISESLALKYLHTNEYCSLPSKVIQSRKELINVFASANRELRKEGLQAGEERLNEFCNILFLKIFSEEEDIRESEKKEASIKNEFRWDYFKDKDGQELLSYVNDTVIKNFRIKYGEDIFSSLRIQNPKILKKIINDLNQLSLVGINSDIKGDAFEYFLKAYLANQKKDLGEYFTPRHIVKTLVKIVNPRIGETIYDPFCGTGGMLIESFKHINNKMKRNEENINRLKNNTIFGSEITNNARITKMNMILTGDGHSNIIKQDSLKNPSKRKYDVVITNMPFSLGNFGAEYSELYKEMGLNSQNGDSLCIEHCFNAINTESENPRIGIIVRESILSDNKFKKLREYIYEHGYMEDIINLPNGAFKPYANVKACILCITNISKEKRKKQEKVRCFSVKNDGYTLDTKRRQKEGENDIDRFFTHRNDNNKDRLLDAGFEILNMEEIEKNRYVSIASQYKKFSFISKYETVQLGEFVTEVNIKNNINAPVWSVTNRDGGSFMDQKDFFDEQIASDNTQNYRLVPPLHFAYSPCINVGSIALNETRNTGCVSPIYIVLKSKDEKKLNSKYLYWLLQSNQLKEQIKTYAFGSVRQTLNFCDFCRMTIPIPNIEEQGMIIEELNSYRSVVKVAEQTTYSWKPYININNDAWDIIKIGDICNDVQYGISKEMNTDQDGYQILRMNNLQDGFIDYSDIKYVDIVNDEFEKYKLHRNDILFNRTNSIELVGKTSIFESDKNYCFASYIIRIIVNTEKIIPSFLNYFMNTNKFQKSIKNHAVISNNQANINAQVLLEQEIRIPSLEIQQRIVNELEIERNAIESQKSVIQMFQKKIYAKLDSIWTK